MIAALMRVNGAPIEHYFIWGNRRLSSLSVGGCVKFCRQNANKVSNWQYGLITGYEGDIPVVDTTKDKEGTLK